MSARSIPNLFLIGAPKGGTTALARYLSEHPRIFFSAPKEPHFWDDDHENGRKIHDLRTLDDYLKLFASADPSHHAAIGEGSTTYLQSRKAVEAIVEFNPQAKFLALLRHPVDAAHAMHGELMRHYHEDVTDFEQAWHLQQERAAGRQMPPNPGITEQLQYRDVVSYADQLERLFKHVPAEQRRVFLFDDFASDTRGVYQQVLEFLGIDDDGRTEFPKANQARAYRLGWLGRFYHAPPQLLERPMRLVRSKVMARTGRLKQSVKDMVSTKQPRAQLRPEFRASLLEELRPDIQRTAELLNRDLCHWLEDAPPVTDKLRLDTARPEQVTREEIHG